MKVTLITGGGTGIGAATARRLVAAGEHVVITGRRSAPLDAVAANDERITALPADVADSASARALIAQIQERFGRLDGLVANAGGHGINPIDATDDDDWRASITSNLDTAFVIARESLPLLLSSGGSIVLVSSLAGIRAAPSTAGYTVGKHALIGLMRSLARDYGRRGVRANAVCPGWVRTPMADGEMAELVARGTADDVDAAYELVTKDVPLGRPAATSEIAAAIAFLLGEDASYVHGATLVIDGGAHIVDVPTLAF